MLPPTLYSGRLLLTAAALFFTCLAVADDPIELFPGDGEGSKFAKAFEKTDKSYSDEELAGIFQIEGDEIHVYRGWPHAEAPFATLVSAGDYENFVIELEYKWGDRKFAPRANQKRDAGLLFFVRQPDRVWPPCVECQIQETDSGDLWSIYTMSSVRLDETGTYAPEAKLQLIGATKDFVGTNRAKVEELPGWNAIRVEIKDGAGKFYLNGALVNAFENAFEKDGKQVTAGRIALQAEGAELTYRNVRLRPLK